MIPIERVRGHLLLIATLHDPAVIRKLLARLPLEFATT